MLKFRQPNIHKLHSVAYRKWFDFKCFQPTLLLHTVTLLYQQLLL